MADNLDPEYLRDLEASLQASREAVDDWTTEMLSGRKETELERDARKANIKAAAEEKKAREELGVALDKFKTQFRSAGESFGKALLSTEGGMSKYNAGVKNLTTGIADFAGNFGLAGKAIGVFVKVLGFAVETVTEGNEKLIKSYNDLGEIGATSALTTTELFNLAQTAGYGTRNLEGLIKPVKSLGSGLIALGGSTGEGVKKFAQLAATTEEQRAAYRRLGLSQEEVTQLQADYVNKTTNSGQRIAASTEKQRKAADDYIENLVTLASFTGTDIKKQQEARDRALANESLNQAIYEKELEREELTLRLEKEEDDVKKAAIQKQIDGIEQQIKVRTELGQFAATMTDAKNAQAAYEIAASKGALVLTDSTKAMVTAGMDPQKIVDILNRGGSGVEEYIDQADKMARRVTKQQGDSLSQYGTATSKVQQEIFGLTNEIRKISILRMGTEKKSLEEIKQAYIAKKNASGEEDPVLKAENARLEAEKKARDGMDLLYKTVSGPLNNAFTIFMESLVEFVDWVADTLNLDLGSKEDQDRRKVKKLQKSINRLEQSEVIGTQSIDTMGSVTGTYEAVDNSKEIARLRAEIKRIQGPGQTKFQSQAQVRRIDNASAATTPDAASSTTSVTSPSSSSSSPSSSSSSSSPSSPGSFNYESFAQALGKRESGGNYAAVNSIGFVGKYQFGAMALEDLGLVKSGTGRKGNSKLNDPSVWNIDGGLSAFLKSPEVQESAMKKYTEMHKKQLESMGVLAKSSSPSEIAGYLAAAHLLGPGGAQNLKNGKNGADAYGTSGSTYLALGKQSQMPQAREGGIFSGSNMGFPVELHGNELVAPLDPNSILAKMLTASPSEAAAMMPSAGSSGGISTEMIEAMINKFDTMISYLSEGVDIQQKILRHS